MRQNLSEICASGSEYLRTKAVDFRAKSAKHATFLTALTQPADTAMHRAAPLESRRKGTWKARHATTCLRAVLPWMYPRRISAWRILMRAPLPWDVSRDNRNGSDDIAYAHCATGGACPLRADSSCPTRLRTTPVSC